MSFRRINLSLGIHKASQKIGIFVIDGFNMFFAKMTLFHKNRVFNV